jgi:hypothetical protein
MKTANTTARNKLLRRSREALSALGVQFLLGMGSNLIGSPGDNSGGSRVVAWIVLDLHILVGIGVIVVAVRVWLAARGQEMGKSAALWALVILSATFLIGVGTMLTDNGWLSFLMAAGFLAGAGLYVQTYLMGSRAADPGAPRG